MAFNTNAWGEDGGTYGESSMRDLVAALSGGQAGVVGDSDALQVTQQAAPANTVLVAPGGLVIPATASGETGSYTDWNHADLSSPTIDPTAAGVSRYDRIIARVTAGVTAIEVVKGTAAASPSEPSITGDNYLELARVLLPPSTTNITDAMITDRRVRLGHATVICTSSTRPASPHEGMRIYETDTNRSLVYDGSNWINVRGEFYETTVVSGSAPTAAQRREAGKRSITQRVSASTGAGGGYSVVFPTAFPNGLFGVTISSAHGATNAGLVVSSKNEALTGFDVVVRSHDGAIPAASSVAVTYTADGW